MLQPGNLDVFERNALPAASSFLASARASVFDENPVHGARSDRKEVATVLIPCGARGREADKELVNELDWLEGVINPLVLDKVSRNVAQLPVYNPNQF